MKAILIALCAVAVWLVSPARAEAQQAEAERAATEIMQMLVKQQYNLLWDQHTSKWFQGQTSKSQFLANMSMGRSPLGALSATSQVSIDHATQDPATGVQGDIYALTFQNKYVVGEFFERIVVFKEPDGKYRLSGLWGAPVPKN